MIVARIRGVLLAGLAVLVLAKCGSDEGEAAPIDRATAGCGTTDFSICGYPFDDLTDELGRPAYTAPLNTTVPRWGSDTMCADGAFAARGRCADGRQFLYWQVGGFTEVRYYGMDGRPSAVALMREESACGDPCPRESFYGALEDLRCDDPQTGPICGAIRRLEPGDLPFSQGTPLIACEECAP